MAFGIEKIEIREISEQEISQVAALEKDIFSDPWSSQGIRETFEQNQARIVGAFADGRMAGYLIVYYVLDEAEIARIAVNQEYRRLGVAGELMRWLLAFLDEQGLTRILLDVRESNLAARTFYEKWNFQVDGIRKRYYQNPEESAVLMSRER